MGSVRNLGSSRFKKSVLLVAAIALVSGTSAYAYFSSLPPHVGPRVSVVSFPLELSMELEKIEYTFGENITVTLCVTNVGNETVTITKYAMALGGADDGRLLTEADRVSIPQGSHLIGRLVHVGISIVGEDSMKVYEYGIFGTLDALYDVVIEPGGYLKQKIILVSYDTDYGHIPVPKGGAYQIRAILYHIGVKVGAESTPLVTIETPSIAIISK